jgi:hypothetical protein
MSDAMSPQREAAVELLSKLGQWLPEFCRRAVLGEATEQDWDVVIKALSAALTACCADVIETEREES